MDTIKEVFVFAVCWILFLALSIIVAFGTWSVTFGKKQECKKIYTHSIYETLKPSN